MDYARRYWKTHKHIDSTDYVHILVVCAHSVVATPTDHINSTVSGEHRDEAVHVMEKDSRDGNKRQNNFIEDNVCKSGVE